ncbi:hypothetical protein [Streptomyces hygroscopicus]|uniref:hypothetical protein n=1 Tax=Streptomyces hygroscopicus TaxID=1912 RepID=UPI0004C63CC0|nr:hypothetical protein [Streptomyces hygroscopicus]
MTGPSALVQQLADGEHLPADWRAPFEHVDRARFLPDRVWARVDGGYAPVDRADDPERWQRLAYRDEPVVTQVEDPPGAPVALTPSSSASMPSIVARMLAALQVEDGHRVLEIGTGVRHEVAHCK